jgi:hypothetical protein
LMRAAPASPPRQLGFPARMPHSASRRRFTSSSSRIFCRSSTWADVGSDDIGDLVGASHIRTDATVSWTRAGWPWRNSRRSPALPAPAPEFPRWTRPPRP